MTTAKNLGARQFWHCITLNHSEQVGLNPVRSIMVL